MNGTRLGCVFGYLDSPYDFLSMIFGFVGKFRIDIGKNQCKNIFRDQKNNQTKKLRKKSKKVNKKKH